MGYQYSSMTDAQLQAKLAAAGYPVMPITATTRPLLMKKLQSGLINKGCHESPKYYKTVDNVYSMSDRELQMALVQFGYRVMPVTDTTRKVLVQKLISLYSGTSTSCKVKSNLRCTNEVLYNSPDCDSNSSDGIFTPHLSSLKFNFSEPDKTFKAVTEKKQSSVDQHKANPFSYNNTPTIDDQQIKEEDMRYKNNLNDYEKNIMKMFQTFSSEQEKQFNKMLANISTTSEHIFQNLSNQQEMRFCELLSDLNHVKQDIYNNISNQHDKHFKELSTHLNLERQEMFHTLSCEQNKHFNDLLINTQQTKEEMLQVLADQQDSQFQELLSKLKHITEEKNELVKTLDYLSLKNDNIMFSLQKLSSEKKEGDKQIANLQKKLGLLEQKLSLATLKLRNIPKLLDQEHETKDNLCAFVIKLGNLAGIHIEGSHIKDIYRENHDQNSESVVLEFTTVLMKEKVRSAIEKSIEENSKSMQFNTTNDNLQSQTSVLFFSFLALIFSLYFVTIFIIY